MDASELYDPEFRKLIKSKKPTVIIPVGSLEQHGAHLPITTDSDIVTENLDQGPIIFQDSFKVTPEDTLESIKKRGQKLEATTLLKAVKMHLDNKLEVRWRKVHTKSK